MPLEDDRDAVEDVGRKLSFCKFACGASMNEMCRKKRKCGNSMVAYMRLRQQDVVLEGLSA
jgi:hypothetical protein